MRDDDILIHRRQPQGPVPRQRKPVHREEEWVFRRPAPRTVPAPHIGGHDD